MSYVIDTNNKLILIPHIPKTAGCAVGEYLEKHFDFIYGQSEQPSWDNCSELTRRINGHNRVQECQKAMIDIYGDKLKDKETILISIVRNPWSWWKSWFFFIPQIVNTDSDFQLERNELYTHNMGFEEFLLWMKENKDRCVFQNKDMNTPKYDQMVNWVRDDVFDFDKSYVCETHESGELLPKIFSECGFNSDISILLNNESKSVGYTNNEIYNERTRKIVENFHKDDIIRYDFTWNKYKDMK